jgi:hypothetical protein
MVGSLVRNVATWAEFQFFIFDWSFPKSLDAKGEQVMDVFEMLGPMKRAETPKVPTKSEKVD